MPDIIGPVTVEELTAKVEQHLADLHCSLWGMARENSQPKERQANAEWLVAAVLRSLGIDPTDDLAEYRSHLRHAIIEVTWEEGDDDLDAVAVVSDATDSIMDALCDRGVPGPAISGRLVNSDVSWPGEPASDE